MVKDQGGIQSRVARHGDGVFRYRLGLAEKRATWLLTWLRDKVRARKVTAKEMAQGLGRLGFAAISLTGRGLS